MASYQRTGDPRRTLTLVGSAIFVCALCLRFLDVTGRRGPPTKVPSIEVTPSNESRRDYPGGPHWTEKVAHFPTETDNLLDNP
jgi:hypothetical protein